MTNVYIYLDYFESEYELITALIVLFNHNEILSISLYVNHIIKELWEMLRHIEFIDTIFDRSYQLY